MITYKIVGIEPWENNGIKMQRLYCVHHKEGVVGLATIACSCEARLLPPDVTIDSVVILGFQRQGKYLEFVLPAPDNNVSVSKDDTPFA